VNPNYKDAIKATVDRLYLAQFPQYKDTYRVTFCKTDDGARIVDLPETIDQEANL
jgi:galactokinase/galacturonokinase